MAAKKYLVMYGAILGLIIGIVLGLFILCEEPPCLGFYLYVVLSSIGGISGGIVGVLLGDKFRAKMGYIIIGGLFGGFVGWIIALVSDITIAIVFFS